MRLIGVNYPEDLRDILEEQSKLTNNQVNLIINETFDFIDRRTKEIFPDLLKGIEHIRIKNVSELGEALRLAPELIEDFDSWLEMELDNQAMYELDIRRGK